LAYYQLDYHRPLLPLAAALVAKECFNWTDDNSNKFRATWMLILIPGVILSAIGIKPILIIQFAQLVNGILLPTAAGFLFWAVNNRRIMGQYGNSTFQNVYGFLIFMITLFLGTKVILKVFTVI
jgi:manganese transport protein